jgi:hypothetical protein
MMNTKQGKRDYWANQVKQWKASGETQSNYCRRHNLKPHQMTYWSQVYRSKPQSESASSSHGFVALKVIDSATPALTLLLPNGVRLEGVHAGNLSVVREIIGWQV